MVKTKYILIKKTRRVTALAIALCIVASVLPISALAVYEDGIFPGNISMADNLPTVSIVSPGQPAERGEVVAVRVRIDNNPGLAGLALDIGYDADALELESRTSVTRVREGLDELLFTGLSDATFRNNPFRVSWFGAENDYTNGAILNILFKVKDNAIAGDYTITVKYDPANTGDQDRLPVVLQEVNGTITINPAPTYTTSVTIPAVNGNAPAAAVSNPAAVTEGTVVELPAVTANAGFRFINWEVTSGGVSITNAQSAAGASFVMGNQDVAVNANFGAAALTFSGQTLPAGTVGAAYNASVTPPEGGSGSYTYSASVPAGLSMSADGTISGVPTAAVNGQSFTVTATDTITGATAGATYTITINPAPTYTTSVTIPAVNGKIGRAHV